MERFVTLSKSEKDFASLLTGRFSQTEIAVPTRSLEVATSSEQVTFLIRPFSRLSSSGWVLALTRLFRWNLLAFTFSPMVVIYAYSGGDQYGARMIWAALALLCFHCGVFALNDYVDHVRGLDRVSDSSGSRVIQSGILPAYKVFQISAGLLVASLVLAVPVFKEIPNLLFVGIAAFCFGVFGYSFARTGWRRLLLGSFSVFVTFGPLLVFSAYELFKIELSSNRWIEFAIFSVIFGWMASIYSRARQLGSMMVDHLAGVQTFATKVGFDRAVRFLLLDVVGFVFLFTFSWIRFFTWGPLAILGMIVIAISARLALSVLRAKSPLSSTTQAIPAEVIHLQVVVAMALTVGFLWLNL